MSGSTSSVSVTVHDEHDGDVRQTLVGSDAGAASSGYRKPALIAVLIGVVSTAVVLGVVFATDDSSNSSSSSRNVILMVPDGFGVGALSLLREMSDSPPALDQMLHGTLATMSDSSLVTDSAAAATVYSCGLRTTNGFVGMDDDRTPCVTVLEAAAAKGYRTGLVATSRITHATPASFSAHIDDRDAENEIAVQQIREHFVDVMIGGGRRHFLPQGQPGSVREDSLDLVQEARDKGYNVVLSPLDFEQIDTLPALGLFADSHMPYVIDQQGDEYPSLREMAARAISLLDSGNDKGFFLMVEGSRIDHGEHDNDAGAVYRESLAFDNAVEYILDWAQARDDTLVISVADHETGGLSLGREDWVTGEYPVYYWSPQNLRKVKASAERMQRLVLSGEDPVEVLRREAEVELNADELELLATFDDRREDQEFVVILGELVSRRSNIGWTTPGHTGASVTLHAWAPTELEFLRHAQNTDVAPAMAKWLRIEDDEWGLV